MGMHPMRDPENCPNCGRNLKQGTPPERPYVPKFDGGVAYGLDPVCGGRWPVWDKTSPLRSKAKPYVSGDLS